MSERQKTILIVDDEAHIVHIIRYKLEKAGYAVVMASDGREAYELALELGPDLIVTDFQMPVLSGYEMSVKLSETKATADIPIVMVTGRGHKLSPSELSKTNISHLLCKPFSARELMDVVSELLMGADACDAEGGASAA